MELAKLLTFMYDEDRLHALELYERMFDKAEDEQALLQFLVSPTRQAVLIARVYNSRERKLHVHTESRGLEDAGDGGTEEYIAVIEQERQEAIAQHIISPDVTAGQFSLFDDDSGQTELYVYDAGTLISADSVPSGTGSREPERPAQPAPQAARPGVDDDSAGESAQSEGLPAAQAAEPAHGGDDVDKFMDNFAIKGDELIPESQVEAPAEPAPGPAPASEPAAQDHAAPTGETVLKPRIFLLILFVILAVPITTVGVVLLLIPTLLFLALAVTVVISGVAVLAAALSGFTVLADFMVVLGIALIILSLGLLFTWIFVWFIGGAIMGLVRSVIDLGRSWCYKEVAAV